ncbi:3-hydroxyacyl-CoA dehydrogenase NAD-binding domain-containing protein [Novosphingobium pentaromativorans]|uniref:3-hydroxyacyl-CoA dehydrogenase n=1 Tax=Novosphingobium pentaromativorans US6-1 TaxID=1088721 RepID=G6EHI5_9SPHN|nr:3-hydroxyacyl-CoA dehydrogenase NAD-binding domain-containing protein [Novosphingobium pentaromativorans]AIT81864.1 hypothetical protein JI59_20015 [Novosphingobium pentaromativorans US6-1]EHJ59474.1 3-hydroxyacyl-CoA dehydrogenase [Novosphingobium pentaromativorans US6-1]
MDIDVKDVIGVCGAGVMGAGIAQVAAASGHPVVVFDKAGAALENGRAAIAGALARQVDRGRIAHEQAEAVLSRILWTDDLGALSGSALVVEAIVEQPEAKAALFAEVGSVVGSQCILASNTSSLSIEEMARLVTVPSQFAGLHFFNPVPAMKLVEVVAATCTAPDVTNALVDLMRRWGKRPARVRDVPGFIVNRVARPYYAEAFVALGDGMAAADIDTLLEQAGGFRMGPLELTDMIGQDINYSAASGVYDSYDGKSRFRPQATQRALVEAGKLGRKSGEGVYSYPAGRGDPQVVASSKSMGAIAISTRPCAMALFAEALIESGVPVSIDDNLPEGILSAGGLRMAMGDGRPLRSRGDGVAVLIDHARDIVKARMIGATTQDPEALGTAANLFATLGKAVIAVPDRPGQLVLRTLAQLANAAADAVADDVAKATDIDIAMQYGANHPEGPLAWSKRFGAAELADVLGNIASASGDEMYRPNRFEG